MRGQIERRIIEDRLQRTDNSERANRERDK